MAMGAADVVPGVSGGTIAFITGIYEELIDSIKSFNLTALKNLFSNGIPSFWKSVNGSFLLALVTGIIISVISFARLIGHQLETNPILVWSFFFGLIVASAIFVSKSVSKWDIATIISLIAGVAIAYVITEITPAEPNEAYWFVFVSGALAICAMILPGISGSFILVLLGMYKFVLSALNDLNIMVISVFGVGAVVGLLSFSNVLSWLLKKYHNLTIALLAGFMVGSLNKVWPWKRVMEWSVNRHGDKIPLVQENVLPSTFTELPVQETINANPDAQLLWAVLLAISGFLLIFLFEVFTKKPVKAVN